MNQPQHQQAMLASIDQMNQTLAVATALAEAGRVLDLDGLEMKMTQLCGAVLLLPVPAGRALRPAMSELLARVEDLSTALLR